VVIYIIKSGLVKLYLNSSEDEMHITNLGAKQYFGETGLFIDACRFASAVALEETELIAVTKTDLKQFIKNHPATGIKLLFNFGKSVSTNLINMKKLIKQ
jgi:CRP-like cAMP-binding protein